MIVIGHPIATATGYVLRRDQPIDRGCPRGCRNRPAFIAMIKAPSTLSLCSCVQARAQVSDAAFVRRERVLELAESYESVHPACFRQKKMCAVAPMALLVLFV